MYGRRSVDASAGLCTAQCQTCRTGAAPRCSGSDKSLTGLLAVKQLGAHTPLGLSLMQYNGIRFVVSLAFALVVGSLYYKKGQVRSRVCFPPAEFEAAAVCCAEHAVGRRELPSTSPPCSLGDPLSPGHGSSHRERPCVSACSQLNAPC